MSHLSIELEQSKRQFLSQLEKTTENQVADFEKSIAKLVKSNYVTALNSGTSALHLALLLLGVTKGDFVICSSLSFVATANPILYLGANPIFVDSEDETWNMDPELLQYAIEESIRLNTIPKAVVIVHLYGMPAKLEEVMNICKNHGIPLVEDAAHAFGSKYMGQALGTFGEFGIYSFNNNKLVTALGGGVLISKNPESKNRAVYLATQAKAPRAYYYHHEVGFNYRISPLNASMGYVQLFLLQQKLAQAREFYNYFVDNLKLLQGVVSIREPQFARSNHWRIGVQLPATSPSNVVKIRQLLVSADIECYTFMRPLHLMPLFSRHRYYTKGLGRWLFDHGLTFPGVASTDHVPTIIRIIGDQQQLS